ncbi:unnamed protein product [Clavelina lepadiformis]|uniref:Sister chromatid cohesion protein DCC1 n=1 Tax=Clavelina lepadiformis TaxID=159417 RepID=A0ABP0GUP4_CLALP
MSEVNLDDLRSRVDLAKLELDELLQPAQVLKFAGSAADDNFTLLQLDKDVLQSLEEGKSVVIRGDVDDAAVLCTEDVTYDVKNASTSNMLILLDDCEINQENMKAYSAAQVKGEEAMTVREIEAVGWKQDYLELRKIYPKMTRMIQLLSKSPYKGPQFEEENANQQLYTLSKLMETIQASELEIMTWLCKTNCCCVNGFWRVVDFGYIVECMGELFQLIEAESWSCGSIPIHDACEKINDSGELVPEFMVKHLLGSYGSQFVSEDGAHCFKLSERKICRLFAEMLLRDVGKFNLSEFFEVWKGSLPAGMTSDEKYLSGLALIDRSSRPASICLFKVEELPLDMEARFDALFNAREKWKLSDIEPYIEDICMKGQTVSSVLTKFARTSTLNGEKLYSTRKPLK